MIRAPKPHNDRKRLSALWAYELLDTEPEPAFDMLVNVAANLLHVPIALITLVDVDDDRQWFKAEHGLDGVKSTGRDVSFCAHAILQTGIFEVPDAADDLRFADNPLVTAGPRVAFYAGVPLIEPGGMALGTLCVVDREPRKLTAVQRTQLIDLAHSARGLIEMRIRPSQLDGYHLSVQENAQACARLRTQTDNLRSFSHFMK